MSSFLISVAISIGFWVAISLILSFWRARKKKRTIKAKQPAHQTPPAPSTQTPIAHQAVLAGLALGCTTPKECAEVSLGRQMSESEWRFHSAPWDKAWRDVTQYTSSEDLTMQIETLLLAKVKHGASTAKEAAFIAAREYSDIPLTEAEWSNRESHYQDLRLAIQENTQ